MGQDAARSTCWLCGDVYFSAQCFPGSCNLTLKYFRAIHERCAENFSPVSYFVLNMTMGEVYKNGVFLSLKLNS